jgi:hypothetical protein
MTGVRPLSPSRAPDVGRGPAALLAKGCRARCRPPPPSDPGPAGSTAPSTSPCPVPKGCATSGRPGAAGPAGFSGRVSRQPGRRLLVRRRGRLRPLVGSRRGRSGLTARCRLARPRGPVGAAPAGSLSRPLLWWDGRNELPAQKARRLRLPKLGRRSVRRRWEE